jgi:hypothetical protein
VAAVSHNDAWAVGDGGILRWNGTAWNPVPVPTPPGLFDSLALRAVSVRQASDVWAAGSYSDGSNLHSIAYHWDGVAWTNFFVPGTGVPRGHEGGTLDSVEGITPIGAGEAIAVGGSLFGGSPFIVRCTTLTGCTSMTQPLISGRYLAVDASSAGNVWAVGQESGASATVRYNGTSWAVVPSPNIGTLHGVAVIAPNDVWAVGDDGAIHWDGTTWTQQASFLGMYAVSGIASNDVWAVGLNTTGHNIWHWDGTGWLGINVTPALLQGVSALAADDVWAVGNGGYITRYQAPQQFEDVLPGSTFYSFINDLSCRGIVSGYPCGGAGEPCVPPTNRPYFRPNSDVTRGQLSKIVVLSAGLPTPGGTQTFEDVPIGSTFHIYIEALFSQGAIAGYPCGGPGEPCVPPGNRPYFRPNATSTRGQIAKIVAITANYIDPFGDQTFEDVPVGSTFHLWIENLASRGIIIGYPCGSPGEPCVPPGNKPYFRPSNNVTRGQMSKIAVITFFP